MFVYQNDYRKADFIQQITENQQSSDKFITIILNDQIQIRCPKKLACSLSKKIRIMLKTEKASQDTKTSSNESGEINSLNIYIDDLFTLLNQDLGNINQKDSRKKDIYENELKKQKAYYEKQLTLLFNGFDIAISHQYISKIEKISNELEIVSLIDQLKNDYNIPELHETQHELDVLRTIETFLFSLTEENIEKMIPQALSLFYQTRPEFFCLVLLNQCLIQSKSIEVFVYLFEEILNMIDYISKINETKERKTGRSQESESLIRMLENILRKSLKFCSTYGAYRPEMDVAHEMFPQEYFYLCQLLYSRKLISYRIFKDSFINANWQTMSFYSQDDAPNNISIDPHKIFITKNQYITISDFQQDFTDENCRYKHKSKEKVEEMIKQHKSQYIHKIKLDDNDNVNNDEYVNWITLYLEGESPNPISKAIRNDDLETFQFFVNSKFNNLEEFSYKYGSIKRSIYERKSIINKNVKPIEYAAFFGSEKCFKYLLMNECRLDLAAKYAIAGSNSEIIHICHQQNSSFKDSLILSIRYHRWEITEWLLETLNVCFNALPVVKLCINCGNFNSLHFIIENLLMKKAMTNEFLNELIIVQSMYYMKYEYGFLVTSYKAEISINFEDNLAIFWHEPFFSYIFDKIVPKRIENEKETENENENSENEIENKNPETENKNPENENKNPENENKNPENENKNPETENKNPETEKEEANKAKDHIKDENSEEIKDEKECVNNDKEEGLGGQSLELYDDEDDEINYILRKERASIFYDIPPEMVELVFILQNHFFQINSVPYRSLSPLHVSIENDDNKFLRLLLKHSEIDLNYSTFEHPNPLFYSIKLRNMYAFRIFLKHPKISTISPSSAVTLVSKQFDVTNGDEKGNDILIEMLSIVLKKFQIDQKNNSTFSTIGIFVAYQRHAYRVLEKLILSSNVELNVQNSKGMAILHMAIIDNDRYVFNLLISANNEKERVDLNLRDQIVYKKTEFYKTFKNDKTPIMLCFMHEREEFFDILLDKKSVDILICDSEGNTLTMLIIRNSNNPLVLLKKLFDKKKTDFLKSLQIQDSKKKLPIQVAQEKKYNNVVEFLNNC